MIQDRKKLVLKALTTALKIRQSATRKLSEPICIYDFVEEHGVEVQFLAAPSMEGLYSRKPGPRILINSLRPQGRQAFTCAHEFAHHVFNHGSLVDELNAKGDSNKPEEFLADCFAGFLLMPKLAVSHAFSIRGWDSHAPTPLQLYTIAGLFGVGYSTLIDHMRFSLQLLSSSLADALIKTQPKQIRTKLLGEDSKTNFVIVDPYWAGRSIDIQAGDLILAPNGTMYEGKCIQSLREIGMGILFQGLTPGIGRFCHAESGWAIFVRVSRQAYVGLSKYRHLEEEDE